MAPKKATIPASPVTHLGQHAREKERERERERERDRQTDISGSAFLHQHDTINSQGCLVWWVCLSPLLLLTVPL